jgi:hypothetical protein
MSPPTSTSAKLSPAESFLISSIAPAIAVVFTNPFDTAKVREGARRILIQIDMHFFVYLHIPKSLLHA